MKTSSRRAARKVNTRCECAYTTDSCNTTEITCNEIKQNSSETIQVACRSVFVQFTENRNRSQILDIFHTNERRKEDLDSCMTKTLGIEHYETSSE